MMLMSFSLCFAISIFSAIEINRLAFSGKELHTLKLDKLELDELS